MVVGWVEWLLPKQPQVFGTVNTLFPLAVAQHERIGWWLRRRYVEDCGEAPSVLVAVQQNPSREGFHSHPLLMGTKRLERVRRTEVWADLVAELRLQHGGGQQWSDAGGGFDRTGGAFYRHPVAEEDAYNRAHVRLEPVRTVQDVAAYATRYGVRAGDGLIVIPGDHWGMEFEVA